jgi:radical SAM-linked protein
MLYKVTFTFAKREKMRFISHLDLMRLFMRALRRSGMPMKITEGFSPHPRLSLKRALKLGLESDNEEGSIVLKEIVDIKDFKEGLQKQLPGGIEIKSASLMPIV